MANHQIMIQCVCSKEGASAEELLLQSFYTFLDRILLNGIGIQPNGCEAIK